MATTLQSTHWARSSIDTFVLARQREKGLSPSPDADRRSLVRRVSLDLIGLPPRPDQVEAFVTDERPDAYCRLVDRLLSSPRFGERMTQHWLDVARYADSDGYHDDTNRAMWPYRDWVIRSFNMNKPFDEFTVEQLAGDLLPDATIDQQIGTAFHRNGPTSSEDGANPAEYRIRYAVDRVNTTATVWLGMTFACAQCHDHKYDPLTMREYYQLLAFFNQTLEEPLFRGLYAPPTIELPTPEQSSNQNQLRATIEQKRAILRNAEQQIALDQQSWENTLGLIPETTFGREGLVAEFLFTGEGNHRMVNSGRRRQPAQLRPSAHGEDPRSTRGLIDGAFQFTGAGGVVDLGQLFEFRHGTGFTFGTWIKYEEPGGCVISKIDPELGMRGLDISVKDRHVTIRLIHQWPSAAIQVTTTSQYPANHWLHLVVTYDGSSGPQGIYIYFNGKSQEFAVNQRTSLVRKLHNGAPLLIGGLQDESPFHGVIDDVQFYKWPINSQELATALFRGLRRIAILPRTTRSADQTAFIDAFYREQINLSTTSLRREISDAESAEKKLSESIQKLRVMANGSKHRDTHVLFRGDFRQPGEKVLPNTPAFLPPLPTISPPVKIYSRLDLARWLTTSENPLTARVTVNRFWGLIFGRPIVATPDDFGMRGELPSHPRLLDWLAFEFSHRGWNVKFLLREIVTSSTYQQTSSAPNDLRNRDPNNRFLTRGSRFRLPAEMLRDNVLEISGLLNDRIGGPSVRPYQPPGLWRDMAKGDDESKNYVQSHAADLYRRGLYTFWKRSIHYPTFALFDAPNREICTVNRPVTNTPLQALVTLNDPTFVEAARVFAERILHGNSAHFDERLDFAFRCALARSPSTNETNTIRTIRDDLFEVFKREPEAAGQLIQNEEHQMTTGVHLVELAVWTAITQIILNLDETMTKE